MKQTVSATVAPATTAPPDVAEARAAIGVWDRPGTVRSRDPPPTVSIIICRTRLPNERHHMSDRTEPHHRGCYCDHCLTSFAPYKVICAGSSPDEVRQGASISIEDATDAQLARIITAYPTELYVESTSDSSYRSQYGTRVAGPGITVEVTGQWGDGAARTVTFTAHNKSSWAKSPAPYVRTITVGDVRTVLDAYYADTDGRGNVNRRVVAGRYRLQTRSLLTEAGSASVAELIAVCEGLRDPVIEVEADTASDYGNDGDCYDHGVASANVLGWELIPA